ncbi:MAG: CRTAC1 family protein [Rhodothermaceae bacterium]|nr:CRTAC1 family protein [Rhodothermaceae bacterium]MYD19255.1 CRTAC1 family protein [Rhodothermaceae bacterium]MYD56893.1 CRTAC1 family protein [Rhodothermaceae bacterium]MYI44260.1 CRTAC1 family protein [Rhodothermaceae bacterium]MYJ55902.1 CRTAC1 family protein [Rhodothermaceae bacterium]
MSSSRIVKTGLMIALFVSAGCGSETDEEAPEVGRRTVEIVFTDVTEESGLGDFQHETGAFGEKWFPETMGAGGGFLDYDSDGILDVLLVSGGFFSSGEQVSPPTLRLYKGIGDGTFSDVTQESGLAGLQAYAFGVSVADYDNDTDADIFVTALYENLLLRNDEGVFSEVSAEAGLGGYREWSAAGVFMDANLDGWLDLYVGNYVDWTPEKDIYCTRVGDKKSYCTPEQYEGISGRFYVNLGDGTFEEQSDDFRGLPGKTLGAASLDYNRDGWSDLIVANDTQRDLLFENQRDGTFIEKGIVSGIAFDETGRARAGMGLDVGVVDETGRETVFVGHFSGEMVGVYRHAGSGIFIERAAVSQIGRPSLPTLTFGLLLADFDLDGDLDLLTANGHITEDIGEVEEGITFRQRTQLYVNEGGGLFSEIEASGALAEHMVARGAAWADYDMDGDPDVLISENGGPARLWRNDTQPGSSLIVQLTGNSSNRDGIGSRVRVKTDQGWQERYVRGGASYLSQNQQWPLFGLGLSAVADSLEVYWPDGTLTVREAVPAGVIKLTEES